MVLSCQLSPRPWIIPRSGLRCGYTYAMLVGRNICLLQLKTFRTWPIRYKCGLVFAVDGDGLIIFMSLISFKLVWYFKIIFSLWISYPSSRTVMKFPLPYRFNHRQSLLLLPPKKYLCFARLHSFIYHWVWALLHECPCHSDVSHFLWWLMW